MGDVIPSDMAYHPGARRVRRCMSLYVSRKGRGIAFLDQCAGSWRFRVPQARGRIAAPGVRVPLGMTSVECRPRVCLCRDLPMEAPEWELPRRRRPWAR